MNASNPTNEQPSVWKRIHWTVWCLLSVGVALLLIEHWSHALGVLPYLVLLACPLMHLFMHRGHGHGHDKREPSHKKGESS